MAPWNIHAVHPATYLITLHTLGPDIVVAKLSEMARKRNPSTEDLLIRLGVSVPDFVCHVAESVGYKLGSLD